MTDQQTTEPDEVGGNLSPTSVATSDHGRKSDTEQTSGEVAQKSDADGGNLPPSDADDEPETFPRAYVEQLRAEAAEHRVKAKDRDTLAERLHVALVAATGRLADPTDLPFDEAHLDEAALTAAIDALLARKPHLASRRPKGAVGQGASASSADVDLAGILRART